MADAKKLRYSTPPILKKSKLKKKEMLYPNEKLVNIYRTAKIDQNFDDYPGFQPPSPNTCPKIWNTVYEKIQTF